MKRMNSGIAAILLAMLLAATACSTREDEHSAEAANSEGHAEEAHAEGDEGGGERAITMDSAAMEAAGVKLAKLSADVMEEQLRAPGEVLDDAYGTTLITPRVEGLVVRRHARLGDEVKPGAPLVTLSSVEVSEAQGELAVAEQEWQRVASLGADAVSGRRFAEARIRVEQARAKARAYGIPGTARGDANGEFTLTAPHAGRITEDAFVVGERIEPGRTLFRLVDERIVWIDAKLPAEVARDVSPGSTATVVTAGARLTGKVLRQAHRTSETTRNATVRIEVDNRDDRLHAGDYVDVYLESRGATQPQVSVPNNALVQIEGQAVVFKQDANGALVPVEVRAGSVIGDRTLIEEGVAAGDTVVVEGAFALKAQLLKGELGEGHAH
jgi:cobalt-zinc-cadmium efflux system membrane fusion protein